jgi:hypothetical protein
MPRAGFEPATPATKRGHRDRPYKYIECPFNQEDNSGIFKCRVMAQAVSRRPLTKESRVRARVSPEQRNI